MKLLINIEKLTRKEIQDSIGNEDWQKVRISMKGVSLKEKIVICNNWLEENEFSKESRIQVINYINALKRSLYSKEIYSFIN